MRLAFYHGYSWVSRAIQRFTRSPISHVAILHEGVVVEAWHLPMFDPKWDLRPKGKVTVHWGKGEDGLYALHSPSTRIDLFSCPAVEEDHDLAAKIWAFILSQEGALYDFQMVGRFITRLSEAASSKGRWFCSELAAEAFFRNRVLLLERTPAWEVSPGMLYSSPLLQYERSTWKEKGAGPVSWDDPELH